MSYIQDLVGDENPIDIHCAILQCMLQDAIFERLVAGQGRKPATMEEITDICRITLAEPLKYIYTEVTLDYGDESGKTVFRIPKQ